MEGELGAIYNGGRGSYRKKRSALVAGALVVRRRARGHAGREGNLLCELRRCLAMATAVQRSLLNFDFSVVLSRSLTSVLTVDLDAV